MRPAPAQTGPAAWAPESKLGHQRELLLLLPGSFKSGASQPEEEAPPPSKRKTAIDDITVRVREPLAYMFHERSPCLGQGEESDVGQAPPVPGNLLQLPDWWDEPHDPPRAGTVKSVLPMPFTRHGAHCG
jgi:hypothetical protein